MTRRSLQSIRQWMNELKPLVPPSKEEGVYTLPQIAIQEIDRVSEGMSDYIDTLEARVERWKRYANALDKYRAEDTDESIANVDAAWEDLIEHGDMEV